MLDVLPLVLEDLPHYKAIASLENPCIDVT